MDFVATLQCQDQPGIVNAMTTAILASAGNIIENQQFTDPITNNFVMRTRFETEKGDRDVDSILRDELSRFSPSLQLRRHSTPKRVIVLVTRESHCLRDLLYLVELGELPIEIPLVISNRDDLKNLVISHGINFEYLPVTNLNKSAQESIILQRVKDLNVDLLVLARYMQVLSAEFCEVMNQSIINIHHSFLPGFRGAKPYHQAYEHGVKVIGATAHFVTKDLDEGPIIEQDVVHVTHAVTPDQLIYIGRDIERRVLAQAVKLFAEDRIFLVGNRTVVFNN